MATSLAPNTVLVTGGTGQTAPGLTVIALPSDWPTVPDAGPTFGTADFFDAPTFAVGYGSNALAGAGTAGHSLTGAVMCTTIGGGFSPNDKPGSWNFPDGPINQGMRLRCGTGVPSGTTCGPSVEGDQYVRRDGTPISLGGSGVLYQCQFAGNPGTYVAMA